MVNKVKHLADFPEWFSLDKYINASNLDFAGWYNQLDWRFRMLLSMSYTTNDLWVIDEPIPIERDLNDQLKQARIEPITCTVFILTALPIDMVEKKDKFNINVKVNLEIPDTILIEQFAKLLHTTRRRLREVDKELDSKSILKFNLEAWIRFGILPYLDLHIWQKEKGKKIPNRLLADAIFPLGEGGEEVIRKTTKKIAQQLMNGKFLRKLGVMATKQIVEQNDQ